jgi:hypothetical protein
MENNLSSKFFFFFFVLASSLFAVQTKYYSDDDIYIKIQKLSEFIASEQFAETKKNNSELALVDTIYLRALEEMNNDQSEALLLLTFVTLPFNEFPFELGIFNIEFGIPLPSASDSIYLEKNKNLPKLLFFDSRLNDFGDKDKLAHFFGNAFLSNNISFFNLSKFLGILVELIEDAFSKDGKIDWKDIIVNHLGELYGRLLDENEDILPSEVLKIYSLFFYKHSNL